MTDNDIIKALNGADGLEHISIYCADNNGEDVTSIKIVDIIDLINRQQAEIERLKTQLHLEKYTDVAKRNIEAEAIKRFAERFVKLDKADVHSISVIGIGRDGVCGDVYVNTEYISVIDGCFVSTDKFSICCTDKGLKKVLSAIKKEGVQG